MAMTAKFRKVFGDTKPIIAMVHFGALPGSPLYDASAGVEGILAGARKDLAALQDAGVDAVMFGNENDRPTNSMWTRLPPPPWPIASARCAPT